MNKVLLSLCFSFLASLAVPAQAQVKAIMEGVPSSNSTILVSTRTGRVVTTGLHVSSASNHIGASTFQSSVTINSQVGIGTGTALAGVGLTVADVSGGGGNSLIDINTPVSSLGSAGSFLRFRRASVNKYHLGLGPISGSSTFELAALGTVYLEMNESGALKTTGGSTFQVGSGGTPLAVISTGTYTPTISLITNVGSTGTATANYYRVGNIVTVYGEANVAAASAAATEYDISLPVASAIALTSDCAGAGSTATSISGRIVGKSANTTCRVDFVAADTSSKLWGYQFSYTIK